MDENLRTDYAKIRHLITVRLNGNFHVLEDIVSGATVSEQLVRSFQAKEITKRENFVSLHRLVLVFHGGVCVLSDEV